MKSLIGWVALIAPLAFLLSSIDGLMQVSQAFAWIMLIISIPTALIGIAKSTDEEWADVRKDVFKSQPVRRTMKVVGHIAIIALFAYHGMVITAIAWAIHWGLLQLARGVLREAHKHEQEGLIT